ncbi:oligosaccharide flippase family protein [Clostridium sp.]|uniref:oligosaccharide flippase family protein n=1 Tax=Clostridium sp. TaxID=1506 RepID=UPI001A428D04|nr:oligosaccharide flippase family protein [Clostridium sp.]MBK5240618.1 oligosaccharide flippase family protein [Clostridium sp.]
MSINSKKLLKISLVYAAGQIFVQGLNFLLLPIYTNKLGVIEYGKISTITAFTGFISSFLILSIQSGLCRFYKDEDNKNKIVNTALNFAYLFSGIMLLLVWALGSPLSKLIFDFGDGYKILCIIVITSIFSQISSIYTGKYSMEYSALKVSIIQVSQLTLQFIIIIYLVLKMEIGLMGVLYGQLIATSTVFLILTIIEIKNYKFEIDKILLKSMMIFSLGLLPVNLSGWVLTLSDRYFIKHFNGFAQTGIYNLGYQFGMLINPIFITPFLSSFTAYKFEIYKNVDAKEKFKNLFRKYNVIGCFIMLGIAIYSKFGIMIFANSDFANAYKVVPLILYSYFLYGKIGYYALGFQIENKTYKIGLYMGFAAVLNIVLNFFLVPAWGIIGAGISTIISYVVLNSIFIKTSNKYYKIDLDTKFQSKVQIVTLALYGIYYIISIRNIGIVKEFVINIFIMIFYLYLLVKIKCIDVDFIYNNTLGLLKRKTEVK